MITAVDTSVLLDVFKNDPKHCAASADALREAITKGSLIACDIVWAETAAVFDNPRLFREVMERLEIQFSPLGEDSAELAGVTWANYRKQGGTRTRVVADFLVAAHAQIQADCLLSRDRGFYRGYFRKLSIVDPASA
jgi:predicted nucleic acid-binding protein